MIKLVAAEIGIRKWIQQNIEKALECFQGFLAIYRYKEKVVRVGDFYLDTLVL